MSAEAIPQHMEALQRANAIRLSRNDLRHRVADGRTSVADAMREEAAQTMTLFQLLAAQDRWGRTKTLKVLNTYKIGELVQVGELTERQRNLVTNHLEHGPPDHVPSLGAVERAARRERAAAMLRFRQASVLRILVNHRGGQTTSELAAALPGIDVRAALDEFAAKRAIVRVNVDGFELWRV